MLPRRLPLTFVISVHAAARLSNSDPSSEAPAKVTDPEEIKRHGRTHVLHRPPASPPRLERQSLPTHEFAGPYNYGRLEPELSTAGVSTRVETSVCEASAERVDPVVCTERGRATARAISICFAPW